MEEDEGVRCGTQHEQEIGPTARSAADGGPEDWTWFGWAEQSLIELRCLEGVFGWCGSCCPRWGRVTASCVWTLWSSGGLGGKCGMGRGGLQRTDSGSGAETTWDVIEIVGGPSVAEWG